MNTILALAILVIAKMTLAICLVLAPYFFFMYLFNGTKGLSESWLKFCIGSAITPLFLSVILAFTIVIADSSMSTISKNSHAIIGAARAAPPSFSGITSYFCLSLITIGLVFKSSDMAATLTASLSQMTMGSLGRRFQQGSSAVRSGFNQARGRAQKVQSTYQSRQGRLMDDIRERAKEKSRDADIIKASQKRTGDKQ